MAKFYGPVGYVETVETSPGVWEEDITERTHYGDVIRNIHRVQSAEKLTDDIVIDNQISIVGSPYAFANFHHIRYAKFMGTNWEVANVEVKYPRLILTLGGIFNG